MYNEEYKKRYMQELVENDKYKKAVEVISTYFNLSEKMETQLDKDVANFTLSEIIDFYKSICTTSDLYLASINSQLSAYCKWNGEQGMSLDNQNHFDEIGRDVLTQCINKGILDSQYITKSELYTYLDTYNFDNISDKFLLIAFFEGISGKAYDEILHLYPEDIEGNKVKLCSGRELEVSNKFVNIALESANEYGYVIGVRVCSFDKTDGRCFKRFKSTPEREKYAVIERMQKLMEQFSCNAFNRGALMESGRLDRIKTYMKKHNCDMATCLNDDKFREQLEYRYGKFQSRLSYCRKYEELINRDLGRK